MPSKSDYPGQSPSTDGGGDHGISSLEKGCWSWLLLGEGETVSSGVWSLIAPVPVHSPTPVCIQAAPSGLRGFKKERDQ